MDRSAPFLHDILVTKEGVTKLLKGLSPSKALGPDKLHPRVGFWSGNLFLFALFPDLCLFVPFPKGTGYRIRSGIRPSLPAVK